MHVTVMSWYSTTLFAILMVAVICGISIYDKYYAAETMEQRHERRMKEILEKREREMEEKMANMNQTNAGE